jgi:hypothetical protein
VRTAETHRERLMRAGHSLRGRPHQIRRGQRPYLSRIGSLILAGLFSERGRAGSPLRSACRAFWPLAE